MNLVEVHPKYCMRNTYTKKLCCLSETQIQLGVLYLLNLAFQALEHLLYVINELRLEWY